MRTLFYICVLGLLYQVILFPVLLWMAALIKGIKTPAPAEPGPDTERASQGHVSVLLVVRNASSYIREKVENCLAWENLPETFEVLVASDGSCDGTADILRNYEDPRVRVFIYPDHMGKIHIINDMVSKARGNILVFTDGHAMIPSESMSKLLTTFEDPCVGGVCGRKTLSSTTSQMTRAQNTYSSFEDRLRWWESCLSSVASNEGFFYGVRKTLIPRIPPAVTDDLYIAMAVVHSEKRFVFEPFALASIPVRAKTSISEIIRRRRIVCQSLRGLWLMRGLLNPARFGHYAWILFTHKVLRRLVPVLLAGALISNAGLLEHGFGFVSLFCCQIVAYGIAVLMHLFNFLQFGIFSKWYYFCLGNFGTLLGLWDFLTGVRYEKWEPLKEK